MGKKRCKKCVQFGCLTVREHPIVLGDNPAAKAGPPLAIDWHHFREYTIDLEEYEAARSTASAATGRCDYFDMKLCPTVRTNILKQQGYSPAEIVQGTRPVNIARGQRIRTSQQHKNLHTVQELFEGLMDSSMNTITLGARKRKERELLEPYLNNKLCKALD